jgi:serine/threonine-protein kinase RsbW
MSTRRHANPATTTRRHGRPETTSRRESRGHTTRLNRPVIRLGDWEPRGLIVLDRAWPARLDRKQEVIDVVCGQLVGRGWVQEAERPWLVLCLDEAVTNAMLHGDEGDPRLEVRLRVASDGRRWQVAVDDQGTGFQPEAIPDPEDPASLLLEHGRGVRLMRSWLASVVYFRRGSCAVLSRIRSDL